MTATHDITAAEAAAHARLEKNYRDASSAAREAEGKVKNSRAKLRDRVPLSEDEDERNKGVRKTTIAGIPIRIVPTSNGEHGSMSVKKYLELGGRLTKRMQQCITKPSRYDAWTVGDPPADAASTPADASCVAAAAASVAATLAGDA